MKIQTFHKNRTALLTWIILPFIVVWSGVNYIVGSMRHPQWELEGQVLADTTQDSSLFTSEHFIPLLLRDLPGVRRGFVTFWFDDAWISQFSQAFPVLSRIKYKAALSVPTNAVGTYNYMQWSHVRQLAQEGWEITAHSRSHNCDTQTMTIDTILSETRGSKVDLLSHGLSSDIYVTPCSSDSEQLLTYIPKFFVALRTGVGGINPIPLESPYNILSYGITNTTSLSEIREWMREAQDQNGWLILMFHRIDTSETEYAITPQFFQSIVDEVKNSSLTVALPSEVLMQTKPDETP